jgi:hypothetical protein
MTFQEIKIIATGPCIANQWRDVNTIYDDINLLCNDPVIGAPIHGFYLITQIK